MSVPVPVVEFTVIELPVGLITSGVVGSPGDESRFRRYSPIRRRGCFRLSQIPPSLR